MAHPLPSKWFCSPQANQGLRACPKTASPDPVCCRPHPAGVNKPGVGGTSTGLNNPAVFQRVFLLPTSVSRQSIDRDEGATRRCIKYFMADYRCLPTSAARPLPETK